jgi:hypothetical protein
MEYIHQAHYGHIGEVHTSRPQLVKKGNNIYATSWNNTAGVQGKALYTVRGNHVFSTEHHPDGKSTHALYEIRGDKMHTTVHHAEHNASTHTFEIKSSM